MTKKILITDHVHPLLTKGLKEAGFEVIDNPDFKFDDLSFVIPTLFGIVINSKIKMNREIIKRAVHLNFIARLGSGLEIIDLEAAKEYGVRIINSPLGNANSVSEHALGMLLNLANNLCKSNTEVKSLQWNREENRGWELEGKTVGIIGFGHTGSAFAKKLMGFDVNILAYDKYKKNYTADRPYIKESTLEEIQSQADIISFHLPLTPETKHYFDDEFLNQCQNEVVIINTSRGNVIKTESLVKGLLQKKVKAACLDVFENEKPHTYSESELKLYKTLFSFPQVIVSPHIAGWTHESLIKIATIILDKILQNQDIN